MTMDNKHFKLWQNNRETEILIKESGHRLRMTNGQFFEFMRFLGPLVETVQINAHFRS